MNNDPNLIGNTRVIDKPEDMVQRDVYEYILYIGEVLGVRSNGDHVLPDKYLDVIDAINRIMVGEGLETVHGGFFTDGVDTNIQSHNDAPLSHKNLRIDAGEIQQINNELVSVIEEIDEELLASNPELAIHNTNKFAHPNIIIDGAIISNVPIDNITLDEHNMDETAHGTMQVDGNDDGEGLDGGLI